MSDSFRYVYLGFFLVLFAVPISLALDVPFSIELRNTTNHLVTGTNNISIAISDNTSDCTNSLIINRTFSNGIVNGNSNGTTITGLNNVSCGHRYGVCIYIDGAVQGGTQNMTLCNAFINESSLNASSIFNVGGINSSGDLNSTNNLNISKNATIGGNLTLNGAFSGNIGCGNITGTSSNLCTITGSGDSNANLSGYGSSGFFGRWVNGSVINYSTVIQESVLGSAINLTGHLNISKNLTVSGNIYGNLGCGNITGASSNLCTITASGDSNANVSGYGSSSKFALWSNGSVINYSTILIESASGSAINVSGNLNITKNLTVEGNFTLNGAFTGNLGCGNITGATSNLCTLTDSNSRADNNSNVSGYGSSSKFGIWANGSTINYSIVLEESVQGQALNITGSLNISKNLTVSGNIYGNLGCGNITGASSNLCTLVDTDTDTNSRADNNSNVSGYGSANKFAIWVNGSVVNYTTVVQEIRNVSVANDSTINITGHLNITKNLTVLGNIYGNLGCGNITGATSNLCTLIDTDTDTNSRADNNSNVSGYGALSRVAIWVNGSQLNYSGIVTDDGSTVINNGSLTVKGTLNANLSVNNLSGTVSVQQGGTGLNTIAASRLLWSSSLDTLTVVSLGGSLGVSSSVLNVINGTALGKVQIQNNDGTNLTRVPAFRFRNSSTVTFNLVDNNTNGTIDISANVSVSSSSGGNVSSFGAVSGELAKFASDATNITFSIASDDGANISVDGNVKATGNITASGAGFFGNLGCGNITGATSNLCTLVDTDTDTNSRADNNSNVSGYGSANKFAMWFNGSVLNYSTILQESVIGSAINLTGHLNISKNLTVSGNIYGNLGCGNITGASSNLCTITDTNSGGNVSSYAGSQNTIPKFDSTGTNLTSSSITDNGVGVNITGNLTVSKNITTLSNYICLVANCSHYIYFNGSATVIT